MARIKYAQVENKNALLELLEDGRSFEKIYLANNAYKDEKTRKIVELAHKAGIPVERVSRKAVSRRSRTSSMESVVGLLDIDNMYTLDELIDEVYEKKETPFFMIFDNIKYPQNIGAIFRSGFAAGVNGVIMPINKGNVLSDEVIRISMGTCLRIPIVEMNFFEALNTLKDNAIKSVAVDMSGETMYDADLSGGVALVMGSEDVGPSSKILERVDNTISIPMRKGLGSLNVSAAASIVFYEKLRQEYEIFSK